MKLETVSTTRETIPVSFLEFFELRLEDADLLEPPDFARAPEALFALPDVALDLVELLFDLDDVARPFLAEPVLEEVVLDFDPEPFPDLEDLAFAEEDFALEDEFDRLDFPVDEVERERDPVDPVERELLVDFPRAEELFAEDDPLFDLLALPDLAVPFDRDEADFPVPFFAEPDLAEVDLDAPPLERDEAVLDDPLLEREEADFAVPFFDDDAFPDLELLELDLELDDFFVVAIFASFGN